MDVICVVLDSIIPDITDVVSPFFVCFLVKLTQLVFKSLNIVTISFQPLFESSVPFVIRFFDLVCRHTCGVRRWLWKFIHTTSDKLFSFGNPFWCRSDLCWILSGLEFFFGSFNRLIRIFYETLFYGLFGFFVGFVLSFLYFFSFTRFVVFFCFFKLGFCVAFSLVFHKYVFISVIFFFLSFVFRSWVKVICRVF